MMRSGSELGSFRGGEEGAGVNLVLVRVVAK